ncbi:hypothetical protein ACIBBE_42825 [Streptomyces sp. NPDC051644]|uniref:hypothetical protein n=1 Tax=Streptomyces sp. NPDC051644 TaxID=3365666 RepID=UPI0037A171A1
MDELPQLKIEGGDAWYRAVPPPAVPVPAVNMPPDLHGERAILSDPGTGSIYDLRILGDVRRDSGSATVNVVPELDYWRTTIAPHRPVHPRTVPLEHVFIEHRLPYEPPGQDQLPPEPPRTGDADYLLRRIAPGPDQPGARTPVPARTVGNVHGRRIIQATPLGFSWDLRAISEPYETEAHDIVVNLTSAHEYYRWILTGSHPDPVPIGLYLLWTE